MRHNGVGRKLEGGSSKLTAMQGAVLFLDIVNYTPLTESYFAGRPDFPEALPKLLNGYFSKAVEVIHMLDGDVIAFAGDAIVAFWQAKDDDVEHATHAAAFVALELNARLLNSAEHTKVGMSHRISISSGILDWFDVKTKSGRRHAFATGKPLAEVGRIYRQAQPDNIVLSTRSIDLLRDIAVGVEAGNGVFNLKGLATQPALTASNPSDIPIVQDAAQYLSPSLVTRIEAGHSKWLAEYRLVTVVYIGFQYPIAADAQAEPLAQMVDIISTIEAAMEIAGGCVEQICADGSGLNLVSAFGLPGATHEDDAVRAIGAAQNIQRGFKKLGRNFGIGIATGRAFCGDYGGKDRRVFSIVGPPINRAARLMNLGNGNIFCDPDTMQSADQHFNFEIEPQTKLKGLSTSFIVYKPGAQISVAPRSVDLEIEGRRPQTMLWAKQLAKAKQGTGGLVIVAGEPGIGKSRLLREMTRLADLAGAKVVSANCMPSEHLTPYFAWRSLLPAVLSHDSEPKLSLTLRFTELIAAREDLIPWMSLINDVLELDLPATQTSVRMGASARAESLQELMIHVISHYASKSPLVLLIDDAHWLDSASANMIAAVRQRVPNVLILLSKRPREIVKLPETVELLTSKDALDIQLGSLSQSDTASLIAGKLGARSVQSEATEFIFQQTGGHPLHTEELALALKGRGWLQVIGGVCQIDTSKADLLPDTMPTSLRGAISARIDDVDAKCQMVAKVASTIRQAFTQDRILEIMPVTSDPQNMSRCLLQLEKSDILRRATLGNQQVYEFCHAIIHEVAYELLTGDQRLILHKSNAVWVETNFEDNLTSHIAWLATQWELAADFDRAISYLEKCSALAVRNFANREAIEYLNKAWVLAKGAGIEIEPARDSQWRYLHGEASHQLSDFASSEVHFDAALAYLNQPLHRKPIFQTVDIVYDAAVQCVRRFKPRPIPSQSADPDDVDSISTAKIYERLSEQAYFNNEMVSVLHRTLRSLSLAEAAGERREMITGYGALAIGLGISGLPAAARYYLNRGIDLAEASGNVDEIGYAHLYACVHAAGMGDWQRVESSGERCNKLFGELGDRFRQQQALSVLCYARLLQGQFQSAEASLTSWRTSVAQGASPQVLCWSLGAEFLTHLSRDSLSVDVLDALAQLPQNLLSEADKLLCHGLRALGHWHLGHRDEAVKAALAGLESMCKFPPSAWHVIPAVAGIVETLIGACETELRESKKGGPTLKHATTSLRHARRFVRKIPAAGPRIQLLSARLARICGKIKKSRIYAYSARDNAKSLDMRLDLALTYLELCQLEVSNGQERMTHRKHAENLFAEMGVDGGHVS